MKFISLFSGIDAASVAWRPLGWEAIAFSEIEKFPCEVLNKHYPNVPNFGDITKVDWRNYGGAVDIVIGGSPCQSFSIAGGREGLRGKSGLMFEFIRAVQEILPRYFIWENVTGALSIDKGAAFGQLLVEMEKLGYNLAWRVLDAQFFGVGQRRKRVFLVGELGNGRSASEILFNKGAMQITDREIQRERERISELRSQSIDIYGLHGGSVGRKHKNGPCGNGLNKQVSYTITAMGVHCVVDCEKWIARKLTPIEYERLFGFPDNYTLINSYSDAPRYKALGNSMAVPVIRWLGERIASVDYNK